MKLIESPSTSVAKICPIAVWFSAILNVKVDENSGATSLTLVMATVIFLDTVSTPSVAEIVIE